MNDNSCLGPNVDCYNIDFIIIGEGAIISQKTFLCTASHNIDDPYFKLVHEPIVIKKNAWIGAYSYVNRGVIINEYAVVGAYSAVFKNVNTLEVVGGNPSKFIKMRNFIIK
jgi:putative colanic acid biosynthesis acetyltransferase WcaF